MREFWNGLATVRKVSPQLRTARHSGDSAKWFLFQAEPPSVLTLTVRHKGRDTLTTLSAWKKKKKILRSSGREFFSTSPRAEQRAHCASKSAAKQTATATLDWGS